MYEVYDVMYGDDLISISSKYDVSEADLRKINGFDDIHRLSEGDRIVVPTKSNNLFGLYIVKENDDVDSLSKKLGISPDNLLTLNGLERNDYLYPGQELVIPLYNTKFYITKVGDTLKKVASELGTNYDNLIEENKSIYLLPDQLMAIEKGIND